MRAQTKELSPPDSRSATLGQGWKVISPQPGNKEDLGKIIGGDLMEVHTALRHAEAIIRTQQERIKNLEGLALVDELTGLTNRRGFSASLKHELALARRDADYEGILVKINLDGFKSVNDTWGRQTGDAYLCAVADVLREGVRASDTVARLGGDEFALLLVRTDELTGVKRLAGLEKAFQKKSVLSERIPLRASFGFAAYTGASNADAIMQTAELRLCAHKSRGKKPIPVD
jgi:diguanylate cyclase (GGDEF)-like protein